MIGDTQIPESFRPPRLAGGLRVSWMQRRTGANRAVRWGRTCALALIVAAALVANPSSRARAYSEPMSYDLPVGEGGGGGRFFTGTPRDGYSCGVCHAASADVSLSIDGLPPGGYIAGQSYELVIKWPTEVAHVAAVIEMVDDSGTRAGSLQVPRPDALAPSERCSEMGFEGEATAIYDSASGREFATIIDCGAQSMRFLWTAPTSAPSTLWLAGGFVASNNDATVNDDVAFLLRREIPLAGMSPKERTLVEAKGCGVAHSGASARGVSFVFAPVLWLACLQWTRARIRRRGR